MVHILGTVHTLSRSRVSPIRHLAVFLVDNFWRQNLGGAVVDVREFGMFGPQFTAVRQDGRQEPRRCQAAEVSQRRQ